MEKEFDKVKGALEDFGKKVVEAVKKGKDEADKVTRIAQLRIELGSLGRQKRDLYRELGELFYKNYEKGTAKGQTEIAEAITHIKELDKQTATLNRQLKSLREDKPSPRRGRPPKAAAEKSEAPKRRGRPPKSAAAKKTAALKKRGRPPKAASEKTGTPKRRGRPPKSKSE